MYSCDESAKKHPFSYSFDELQAFFKQNGLPGYRAGQLFQWWYKKGVIDYEQMLNLPKELRQKLVDLLPAEVPSFTRKERAPDGTTKYQFAKNGRGFEAVYIPAVAGSKTNTLCISSQSGCPLGCRFCYTASLGAGQNLEVSEFIGQYWSIWQDLGFPKTAAEGKVTNIVFMGMGEPFLNEKNVLAAAGIFNDNRALDISSRRITISSAGILPGIERLGATPYQLAISLNASSDEQRSEVMPVNRRFPLKDLIALLRRYPLAARRRITIEYVLLNEVNDSAEDAKRVAALLRGIPVKINLIRLNPHEATVYQPSTPKRVAVFQQVLLDDGYTVILRQPRGLEAHAACGMLGAFDDNDNQAGEE